MQSIKKIKNTKGKVILLRAGFDVPIKDGKVVDIKRIEMIFPTIKYLMTKGPLVIMSHQGRPKGKVDMAFTQKPLVKVLEKLLKKKIKFAPSCIGGQTEEMAKSLKKGEVLLLENLRFEPGEELNDQAFAKQLARLGDIYVDDAFPDAHREHASIVGVPKYLPSYVGLQFEKEIKYLSLVFKQTKHPFLFILGGVKFETKLPIIKKYLKTADSIFIGGGILNSFLKEKGFEVGISTVEDKDYGIKKFIKNKKLIIPENLLVKTPTGSYIKKNAGEVSKDDIIVDVTDKSLVELYVLIQKAKMILWNGPLGKYEDGGAKASIEVLKMISNSKAKSIIGGGDTASLISKIKMENKFTFVSTGGGASLEYLAKGTLPGIKALK